LSTGAGQIVLDTDFDAIEQGSSQRPVCRVVANAVQSIPDNTQTAITFGQEDIDTHGAHSTSSNTSRVTPTVAGIYDARGTIHLSARGDYTAVNVIIRKNGTTNIAPAERAGNNTAIVASSWATSVLIDMNGTTDYLEITILEDNTLNTAVNTNQSVYLTCVFEVVYVRGPA
jgi:hypothetical protein